jgi:two-component system nitrate/nitrite response regulator NarL
MSVIRVLVVAGIRLVCDVIAATLEDVPDMEVIGAVTSCEQAQNRAAECDVVVMSSRLPHDRTLGLTKTISSTCPAARVLVVGLAESEAEILRYVEAGACGYVLKDASVNDLLGAIRAAKDGRAFVSPEIAGALVSRVAELSQQYAQTTGWRRFYDLTSREQQVYGLIKQGCSNQEIADRLVIEVGTVKNHVHSILQKLGVNTRRQAALRAWASPRTYGITNLRD